MVSPEQVWKSPNLPTLPQVAVELLDLSNNPESEISDYIRVIRSDPAISAKVIKAANSSYFGLTSQVSSIEGAIPLLGSTIVTSLALSFSLVGDRECSPQHRTVYQAFWGRCLLQAVTAETLSRRHRNASPAESFLSGLLCDIGILALLRVVPDEYLPVWERSIAEGIDLHQVEHDTFGFDHREIGATLMANWRMPPQLIDSLTMHHGSADEISAIADRRRQGLIQNVRFATAVGDYLSNEGKHERLPNVTELGARFWKLDTVQVNEFLEQVRQRTDEAASLMQIDTKTLAKPAELLSRANEALAEIAMREHSVMAQAAMKSAVLEMENRRLRETNTVLHKQAGVDALTGLHNRGAFDEIFESMVGNCVRRGSTVGVIFADVDNFKRLNDTFGHQFGDEVLRRVASILKSTLRSSDFIARYGGEEFVIVASDCPPHVVNAISERIRGRVEAESFLHNGQAVRVTISVGACVTPNITFNHPVGDELLAKEMLQQADLAMYDCKRNGRNQILVKQCGLPASDDSALAT